MLCITRITGFRSGPYTVKQPGTVLQIESQSLEMIVPVRIFDNHLYIRIDFLCRFQNQRLTGFSHQVSAVITPALTAFGLDFYIRFTAGKEKIIQDKVIEMPGCIFSYLLYHLPMFGIGITEGFKVIRFIDRIGDAATHFDSPVEEVLLCLFQGFIGNDQQVTVRLQIDFIDLYLLRDYIPGGVQPRKIFHLLYLICTGINRDFEAPIITGKNGRGDQQY